METKIPDMYFENTTLVEKYHSQTGHFLGWWVTPNDGYVLHEKTHDEEIFDEFGEPTGKIKLGYTSASIFVGYNYDRELNDREIYAVKVNKILV